MAKETKKEKDAKAAKETKPTEDAGKSDQPQFAVQRLYAKDLSFEAPNSPEIFREKWEPKISVDLKTESNGLADNVYEVVLSLTVTAMMGEKVAFLAEVHQAGVFTIGNFADDALQQMLGAYCPNLLFPYARETVTSLVGRGDFPQLALAPVNFDAAFAQHLQKKGAEQSPKEKA